MLSPDGNELTTLSRRKATNGGGYSYKKQKKTALFPFIFARTLLDIVDKNEERVDFECWEMDDTNATLKSIRVKMYNLRERKVVGEHFLYRQ